ncbi:MAG: 8-oxo-dGTP pyrophosphatase MutT (NUDIX family) [Glaciecola sp.]|jgi:8-oxo-dGTP pyrophosphatase MutT (NUDIX family)
MNGDSLTGSASELQQRLISLASDPELPAHNRHAAVSIVLRLQPEPDVLLMVRAEDTRDPWSGQVALPGGHRDPGDSNLVHTAARETLEEVGLDLERFAHPIGFLEPVQARNSGRKVSIWVTPVVFIQHGPAPLELGPEASHAFRLPIRATLAGDLDAEHRIDRDQQIRRFPAWAWENRLVWGMTHHILKQCFEKVRDLPEFA